MKGAHAMSGQGAVSIDRRALLAAACVAAIPARVQAAPPPDATVSLSGRPGTLPTIAAALAAAATAARPFAIAVEPGTYDEKLTVTTPNVSITGLGTGMVTGVGPVAVLTHAAAAPHQGPDGRPWGTSGSATLTIAAPGVTLSNLTIRNAHDYLAEKTQAVALKVAREGDRTRIIDCAVEGWQDTLLLDARTWMTGGRIAGVVDFVFGGGAAWIERVVITSRHVPDLPGGFIAAPSTPAAQPHGLVFADCRLECEPGVADDATWLGRPWRAGGNMALTGHAAFLRCWMDAHVRRDGWTAMGFRDPDGVQRMLTPPEARLTEHGSRGPGSGPATADRRMLTAAEAARLVRAAVLNGWRA